MQSVSVLRQIVKVKVDVNGEKELREYKVNELKFKQKKHNLFCFPNDSASRFFLPYQSKLDDAK